MPLSRPNRMLTLMVAATVLMLLSGLTAVVMIERMPNPNHSLAYLALLMVLMSLKVFVSTIQAEVNRRAAIEEMRKEARAIETLIHGDMAVLVRNIEPLVKKVTETTVEEKLELAVSQRIQLELNKKIEELLKAHYDKLNSLRPDREEDQ